MRLTGAGRRVACASLLALSLGAGLGPVVWEATHDARPGASIAPITSRMDSRADRLPGEPLDAYVTRVSRLVHDATAHCTQHGQRSPQTWEVAVARALDLRAIDQQELVTAAGFRCGYCSQRALLLSRILRHNGVSANAYGLNGHVVTSVWIHGRRYFSDPDVGVPLVDPANRKAVNVAYAGRIEKAMVLSPADDVGPYDRGYYDHLAALQRSELELIGLARWLLVLLGPLTLGVTWWRRYRSRAIS